MPGPKKNVNAPTGGRPNTLGLGQRELGDLLDRLESPDSAAKNPKRDFARWPFRKASVRVQFLHTNGTSSWITVACRNISRAGMAILHSAYSHTGTKCRVMLPHPTKGEIPVDGWVTRCSHRSGIVHELGIRFDQHINVQDFLQAHPLSDWFSLERVNPNDLAGRIVCVAEAELDRKILRHFLRGTRLNLVMASSGAEALAGIDSSADLVIIEFHVGDMSGEDLATKLRDNAIDVPLIILTCDTSPAAAASLASAAFVAKPITQDLLLRAVAEFLIVRKTPGAAPAAATGANPALSESMLSALTQYALKLEECIRMNDAQSARTLCLQVAGTAGTVGFKEVNQLATKAAEALTKTQSVTQSISQVRALVAVCRRSEGARSPAITRRQSAA